MATTKFEIAVGGGWTEVGTGPCLVDVRGAQAGRVHTGSSAPALETGDYHLIREDQPFSYGGSDTVYVRETPSMRSGTLTVVVST